jgi:hypothetical protein
MNDHETPDPVVEAPPERNRGKYGDRYHRFEDSLAVRRQREHFEDQHPGLYSQWLTAPNRKERRRLAILVKRSAK